MKTNLSFCMLRVCCLALLGMALAGVYVPLDVGAAATREIKVGMRWPQLVAANGKVFRNVKFTFVSPREIRFMHTDGIGALPVGDVVLSEDLVVTSLSPVDTLGPLGSMMTPEERKLSGIDKLSNQEQTTLAAWVKKAVEDRAQELGKTESKRIVGGMPALAMCPTPAVVASPPITPSPAPLAEPMTITIKATLPPPPSSAEEPPPEELLVSMLTPLTPPQSSPALLPPPIDPADVVSKRKLATERLGVVETRIEGEFQGFETGRKFRLANGQVWRQHEAYVERHAAFEPSVMIYPVKGGWTMKVDGVERAVRVIPYVRDTMADSMEMARR